MSELTPVACPKFTPSNLNMQVDEQPEINCTTSHLTCKVSKTWQPHFASADQDHQYHHMLHQPINMQNNRDITPDYNIPYLLINATTIHKGTSRLLHQPINMHATCKDAEYLTTTFHIHWPRPPQSTNCLTNTSLATSLTSSRSCPVAVNSLCAYQRQGEQGCRWQASIRLAHPLLTYHH